jgi:hypothetical protein
MEQQKLVLKLKEQATLCEYEYETACLAFKGSRNTESSESLEAASQAALVDLEGARAALVAPTSTLKELTELYAFANGLGAVCHMMTRHQTPNLNVQTHRSAVP